MLRIPATETTEKNRICPLWQEGVVEEVQMNISGKDAKKISFVPKEELKWENSNFCCL
jgi:hypothetical protein